MKEMTDKALRLGIIGAVAALLLSVVNNFTEPVIAQRKADELNKALTVLADGGSPGSAEENPAEGVATRWSIDGDKGWILKLEGSGYGGPMTVVASYNTDGSIILARLMENNETVGFGKNAENPDYMKIFIGTGGDTPVPRNKADLGADVDTVSGATITFTGITEALREGSDLVKEWEGR
jgi:electron transport complex protein RnfG